MNCYSYNNCDITKLRETPKVNQYHSKHENVLVEPVGNYVKFVNY